jgi:hypothetical protein
MNERLGSIRIYLSQDIGLCTGMQNPGEKRTYAMLR